MKLSLPFASNRIHGTVLSVTWLLHVYINDCTDVHGAFGINIHTSHLPCSLVVTFNNSVNSDDPLVL